MDFPVIFNIMGRIMNIEKNKELIEKNTLENNLELIIFRRYKHTAGDRCQVTFEAGIDVEIKGEYFEDQALNSLDINNARSLLGKKTSYCYRKTRNFVSENERDKIFTELKRQFLDNSLAYISSPSFPAKLIKRNYAIAQKEETIRLQQEAYLKNT